MPFKTGDMTFAGSRVKIWAGEKKAKTGPLIFYWYATGGSTAEVTRGIPSSAISEITGMGGIIAAMYRTTSMGQNTGNGVWYTGDFDVADEIVACAAKIHDIDTHHIHALGWSAGGLQSGFMAYARSNYMASVSPYSGGSLNRTLQDPSNVPSAILFHGAPGVDVVILDFATSSDQMGADIKMKGGYALNCNHGGGHMIPGAPGPAAAWLFFKAHGYKTKPSPWASMVPMGVPSYCKPY
jgi:poly(3-hydroxybutyrate) depolymerase